MAMAMGMPNHMGVCVNKNLYVENKFGCKLILILITLFLFIGPFVFFIFCWDVQNKTTYCYQCGEIIEVKKGIEDVCNCFWVKKYSKFFF